MEVSEIGKTIRAARVAAGMSQAGVAAKRRVYQGLISTSERGVSIPSATTLCALGSVLPALPLAEMLVTVHRHRVEVREKYSAAAKKRHARQRAEKKDTPEPPRPKKRTCSLTPAQQLAAVAWAANRAGLTYGQFVARTRPEEYPGIYEGYRAHLNGDRE